MATVLKHRRFVKVDTKRNNNKYWYITLYDDGTVKTEYGRVGYNGQVSSDGPFSQPAAERKFESKIKSKLRGKKDGEKAYTEIDVLEATSDTPKTASKAVDQKNLRQLAAEQIGSGDKEVTKLVSYLVKQNIHTIVENTTIQYNAQTGNFSTACGTVTLDTIDDARKFLEKLAKHVSNKRFKGKIVERNLESYLTLIPQHLGMKAPALDRLCPDLDAVKKQNQLLDSLEAGISVFKQSATQDEDKKEDDTPKVWDVSLARVDAKKELDRIRRLYRKTAKSMHTSSSLDVKRVFTVRIKQMADAFEKKGKAIGNIMQLWHGTRVANILSILAKGLIIPPARSSHCTGRMFGNGVYFSDQSTKALNYSHGYWGGFKDNNCFMFLADVAMGKTYTPRSWSEPFPKAGHDSTFAKASVSGVMNNEMIVYKLAQCNLVYLVEFGS